MARPSIPQWLGPVFVGPLVAAWGWVTAFALLSSFGTVGKIIGWLIGMLAGTVWGFLYGALMATVDVGLLAMRVRTFSVGKSAWKQSLLAPSMVLGLYFAFPPMKWIVFGPWGALAMLVLPALASILVARVFWGKRA
jgi:hypothetical protein